MKIFSNGKIVKKNDKVYIELDSKYSKGQKGLKGYSHIQVLWWADKCENEKGQKIIHKKPYKKGPDEIGIFATHSLERPNPIAVSNADIAFIDIEK